MRIYFIIYRSLFSLIWIFHVIHLENVFSTLDAMLLLLQLLLLLRLKLVFIYGCSTWFQSHIKKQSHFSVFKKTNEFNDGNCSAKFLRLYKEWMSEWDRWIEITAKWELTDFTGTRYCFYFRVTSKRIQFFHTQKKTIDSFSNGPNSW